MDIHIVGSGESVYSIAQEYNVSPRSIIANNGLESPYTLVPGQALIILIPQRVHVVEPGETLDSIARRYGMSAVSLMQNNPWLGGGYEILPGQELVLEYYGRRLDDMATTGAAYPGVAESTLRAALPFLTFLSVHTYNATGEGGIEPPEGAIPLLGLAEEYSAAAALSVSAVDENGVFDPALAREILNSHRAQENLINNILDTMRRTGYRAVFLDFDFLLPEDREEYILFVEKLTDALNLYGYPVVVRLSPHAEGLNGGTMEYFGQLGQASNAVILAANVWGRPGGPPMAAAPINEVRAALERTIENIQPEKIFLGIPNYGLDWPLPYVPDQTVARRVSNQEAIRIALNNNAVIQFDPDSMAPYFNYRDSEGVRHVVWFEDPRSIGAKLGLIREYGMRGVSIWTVADLFQPGLTMINALYDIEKVY